MENQIIRIILIGCKEVSTKLFYDLLKRGQCQIVAAYDANPLVSSEFCSLNNIRQIKHFEDIAKINYDAAVITTPSDSHFGLTQYFLEHNKFIFCKSPLIRNTDQYKFISNLPQNKKNLIYTFAIEPGEIVLSELTNLITSKAIKDISSIQINLQSRQNRYLFKNITLISTLSPRLIRILSHIGNYHTGDIQVEDQESIYLDQCIKGSIASSIIKDFNFSLSWAKSNPRNEIILTSNDQTYKVNIDKNTIKISSSNEKKNKILRFENNSVSLSQELEAFLKRIQNPTINHNPLINEIHAPAVNHTKLRRAS